jgi:TRAP transporter 4TM/12TM fusion protein
VSVQAPGSPPASPVARSSRPAWLLVSVIAVAWSLFQLATSYFGVLPLLQQRPIHMSFGFALVFALFPLWPGARGWRRGGGLVADGALVVASVGIGAYVAWHHIDLEWRVGDFYGYEIWLGALAIGLVLEAARRTTGWALPVIASTFLAYAYFGSVMPDLIAHRGFSATRIIGQLYLTSEGIYGLPMNISATLVFNFVLLGAFLKATGTGEFFIDLALSLFGRVRGGPAKVAVVASSFFGSISGSAVANVAGTGSFTIPLMKSTGYRPMFAGAVEAVASSGGQIMPPIMGAAAFLMAELLEVSYFTVVLAALIPAVLYYVAVFCAVDLEAARVGLRGLEADRIPSFVRLLQNRSYFLIPPVTLVFLMGVRQLSPNLSAFWALWACVAVGMLRPETRLGPWRFLATLREGALGSLPIVAACAASGIILGVINLTGIGLRLSSVIVQLASGEVLVLLFLTMITCLILGMGLPVTAAYLIPALIVGPALNDMGIPPLAGHLFILYFGVVSNVTPPFALAAYAGAAIAGSDPMRTGFLAFRLAIPGFLLPYMFVHAPALIGQGTWPAILLAVLPAVVGVVLLTAALTGYLLVGCTPLERVLFFAGALVLIKPGLVTDAAGLALALLALRLQLRRRTRPLPVAAGEEPQPLGGRSTS